MRAAWVFAWAKARTECSWVLGWVDTGTGCGWVLDWCVAGWQRSGVSRLGVCDSGSLLGSKVGTDDVRTLGWSLTGIWLSKTATGSCLGRFENLDLS